MATKKTTKTWKAYIFADGYEVWCAGMNAQERGKEVRKHGKLIKIKELD